MAETHIPPDEILFGKSRGMAEVRQKAQRIAGSNIPLLLSGDGGTGKESLARWIHAHSPYRDGQFVKEVRTGRTGTAPAGEQ